MGKTRVKLQGLIELWRIVVEIGYYVKGGGQLIWKEGGGGGLTKL